MKIDIAIIDNSRGINNNNAILSTTPTGRYSILNIRPNYPVALTISSIQTKFGTRFDDITYYTIGHKTESLPTTARYNLLTIANQSLLSIDNKNLTYIHQIV